MCVWIFEVRGALSTEPYNVTMLSVWNTVAPFVVAVPLICKRGLHSQTPREFELQTQRDEERKAGFTAALMTFNTGIKICK